MIDLEEQFNFTNIRKHPTNAKKVVYRFYRPEQASLFEQKLIAHGIWFEKQRDEEAEGYEMYYAVWRKDEHRTTRLNFEALGQDRKRFIASGGVRWLIIGIVLGMVLLGLVGLGVSLLAEK